MIVSWRLGRKSKKNKKPSQEINSDMEMIMIPRHFCCPISLDLMKDPVTLSTGITYDRESIDKWIEDGNLTCPVTNQVLASFDQIPNHSLRKMIQDWGFENRSYGFERIPTPRVPVTPYEVSEICKRVKAATQRGEKKKCQELVRKIKNWGKESERNKRCVEENGAGCVLSACFESFASAAMEKDDQDLTGEILSVLVWMFPLGEEGQTRLGSIKSLNCLVWFLKSGDLSARQNAALVLKNLLALDQRHVNASVEIEGVVESLVKLIKEPICPTATKASLMAIFYMTSSSSLNEKMIPTFVEMGLVSLIIEILVDGDKSICEKALGVLSHICDCKEGREKVYENALIITVLITKIVSVSNLASELSVSILWKVFKNHKERSGDGDNDAGGVVVEALQVGAIQKLLVLLQVGCGHSTKEKLKELLKLLNQFRVKLGCFDSSEDLKYLKKPY
ncbi:WDSAM1 PROTEIN [Salix viminalis]|uniref:U-box domain-containing protein n=1 Tax=Salix viminalis TaxID=40686 RepID=A0A9Q0TBA4_SALVM|nr:WDSAM1 PROTEIN [Salix viminalis]